MPPLLNDSDIFNWDLPLSLFLDCKIQMPLFIGTWFLSLLAWEVHKVCQWRVKKGSYHERRNLVQQKPKTLINTYLYVSSMSWAVCWFTKAEHILNVFQQLLRPEQHCNDMKSFNPLKTFTCTARLEEIQHKWKCVLLCNHRNHFNLEGGLRLHFNISKLQTLHKT